MHSSGVSDDDDEVAQYVCSVNDIFDVGISHHCLMATQYVLNLLCKQVCMSMQVPTLSRPMSMRITLQLRSKAVIRHHHCTSTRVMFTVLGQHMH